MAKVSKFIESHPDESLAEVAIRGLRSRVVPLQYYLTMAACKPEEDSEYVHQLRTWSRRAAAATAVFADLLPRRRAKWLNKQLRRLRRASNEARDNDVFLAGLACAAHQPGVPPLVARVRAQRAAVQPPIVALYRRLTENQRLEKRLTNLLKRVCWRGAGEEGEIPHFGTWARQQLRRTVDEFFAAGADLTDPEALHQFRLCSKRLRYTMELLGGAFPEQLRREIYPLTVSLQDKLGELNDGVTAEARLEHWLDSSRDPGERAYLEHLLIEVQTRGEQALAAFFGWWTPERQGLLRAGFTQLLSDREPPASCA